MRRASFCYWYDMILVALGANLFAPPNLVAPDGSPPLETCRRAAAALAALPGLSLVALSGWYATAPVPASDQPDYVNGVARLAGEVDPAWLLAQLHAIEAAFGRVRGARNAARTLDLDLIDCHGLIAAAPGPELPHPRAHLRAFVLRPLLDVAPAWVHPLLGRSAADLLASLPPGSERPRPLR